MRKLVGVCLIWAELTKDSCALLLAGIIIITQ
jgi:hypothetical protein